MLVGGVGVTTGFFLLLSGQVMGLVTSGSDRGMSPGVGNWARMGGGIPVGACPRTSKNYQYQNERVVARTGYGFPY